MKKPSLFQKKSQQGITKPAGSRKPEADALDVLLRDFASAETADLPLDDIRKKIDAQIGAELVMLAKSAPRGTTAAAATVADISDTGFQMTEITVEKAKQEAEERLAQKAAEDEARAVRQRAVSEAEMRAAIAAAAAAGTPLAAAAPTPPPASSPEVSALADETARMQTQAAAHDTDSAVTNVKAAKAAAKAAKENAKLAQQNAKKAEKAARALAKKEKSKQAAPAPKAKEPSVKKKPEQKNSLSFLKQLQAKREQRLEQADQDELRTRRLQKPAQEAPKKPLLKKALPYASAAAGVLVLCVAAFAFRDSLFSKADVAAPAAQAPEEAMLTYDMAVAEAPAAAEPAAAAESIAPEAESGVTASGSVDGEDRIYVGEAMPDSGLLESGAEMEGSLEMMLLTADTDYVCYGMLLSSRELLTQHNDTIFLVPGAVSAPTKVEHLFFLKLTEPEGNTYTILQAFPLTAKDALAKEAFTLFPYPEEEPVE